MATPHQVILSQEEVNALLSAVDRGDIAGSAQGPSAPAVIRYHVRTPERVPQDQLTLLSRVHESFGRLFSSSLTTLLRGLVEMELERVEPTRYGEFIRSLASPSCMVVFDMDPLGGSGAMDVSATVLFRLIDRLLGGSGLLPVRLREFTEVEQVLVERIAIRALADLQRAWQHAGTFGFRMERLETNPHRLRLAAPDDLVMVTTFNVKVGEETGRLNLVFPYHLLRHARYRRAAHS